MVARLHQEHRVVAHAGEVPLKHLNAVLEDAAVSRADVEMALATYLVYYGNHVAKEGEDILGVAARHPHGAGLGSRAQGGVG